MSHRGSQLEGILHRCYIVTGVDHCDYIRSTERCVDVPVLGSGCSPFDLGFVGVAGYIDHATERG